MSSNSQHSSALFDEHFYDEHYYDEHTWVIWNGTLGLLDTVTLGEIKLTANGREAWLEEPYDMVGPLDLDVLETLGQIDFAACTVMSRQKWQQDQVELRRAAHKNRRAYQAKMEAEFARFNQRQFGAAPIQQSAEQSHRELLELPAEGALEAAVIKGAFRKLAQKFHPDVGGSHDQFVAITEARDELLMQYG